MSISAFNGMHNLRIKTQKSRLCENLSLCYMMSENTLFTCVSKTSQVYFQTCFQLLVAVWSLLSDGFQKIVYLKSVCVFFLERVRATPLPALTSQGRSCRSLRGVRFVFKLWMHVKFCQIFFLYLLKWSYSPLLYFFFMWWITHTPYLYTQ